MTPPTNSPWLERTVEDPLEPELPICDPHHHLWDSRRDRVAQRYLIDEILADVSAGHNVVSTVFIECGAMYRSSGPQPLRVVGETEFVSGIAAMSASGLYGPCRNREGNSMNDLPEILETSEAERQATGYVFTEGPLWHPAGYFFFNDIRPGTLYRLMLGEAPAMVRETVGGNGLTFDIEGRLVHCEGEARCVTRTEHDGTVAPLVERFQGGRFNRPNDVVCHSDGSIWFTDPSMRVAFSQREIPGPEGVDGIWGGAAVYRVAPDGSISSVVTVEYPNGLAFSPDERTLYIANTRSSEYVHAIEIDASGRMIDRRIFADMSRGEGRGVPDGMKVDARGRVFCTGRGGIWVFEPDGTHLGTIELPEMAVNLAFGGDDLRTLFVTAVTSVYTLRVKTPGQPHPWYRVRKAT